MNCKRLGLCAGVIALVAACGDQIAPGAAARVPSVPGHGIVRVVLRSPVIDLYDSAPIRATAPTARRVDVRLLGANDRTGPAYEWTPYRWQRLRLRARTWRGVLPAPPLFGAYRLQLRLDGGRSYLSSPRWLLRVFPPGTLRRPSGGIPVAAIREFIARLRDHPILVACRHWPPASFDHRDLRLHRLFAVAYAPRGDQRSGSRLGLFVTTVRDGYHGGWRVLQATTEPYD